MRRKPSLRVLLTSGLLLLGGCASPGVDRVDEPSPPHGTTSPSVEAPIQRGFAKILLESAQIFNQSTDPVPFTARLVASTASGPSEYPLQANETVHWEWYNASIGLVESYQGSTWWNSSFKAAGSFLFVATVKTHNGTIVDQRFLAFGVRQVMAETIDCEEDLQAPPVSRLFMCAHSFETEPGDFFILVEFWPHVAFYVETGDGFLIKPNGAELRGGWTVEPIHYGISDAHFAAWPTHVPTGKIPFTAEWRPDATEYTPDVGLRITLVYSGMTNHHEGYLDRVAS